MGSRDTVEAALQAVIRDGAIACLRFGPGAPVVEAAEAVIRGGLEIIEVTLTTPDALQAMREIKLIGAGNAADMRPPGLLGRQRLAAVCQAYERFRGSDGRLPVSYEVVHGHAWGAPQRRVAGETRVPVDALRSRK